MRFFDRNAVSAPRILFSKQAENLKAEISLFIEASQSKGAQRRPPNLNNVLLDTSLENSLSEAFEGVCAFCETPKTDRREGWLHHFRPNGFAANEAGQTDPIHYVWLALEWDNLMLVCPECSRAKGNTFAVQGKRGAVSLNVAALRRTENARLVDPTEQLVVEHMYFLPDGRVMPHSEIGGETIALLKLNRMELVTARKTAIEFAVGLFARNRLGYKFTSERTPPYFTQTRIAALREKDLDYAGAVTDCILNWSKATEGMPVADTFVASMARRSSLERQQIAERILKSSDFIVKHFARQKVETVANEHGYALDEITGSDRKKPGPSRTPKLSKLPLNEAQLSTVHIKNFKALKEISFTLPSSIKNQNTQASSSFDNVPCMLVLGENAVGKSSVLEALTLALLGTRETAHLDKLLDEETLQPADMIHRPDVTNWNVLSDAPLNIDVSYLNEDETTQLSGLANADTFFGTADPSKILLSYGPRRFFRKGKQRRYRAPAYRVRSQFDPLATLPNPVDWLVKCTDKQFDAAARALRVILMLDDDQVFERTDAQVIVETAGRRAPLSEMSVGYKSVVALATDIIRELFYYYDNTEFAHAVVLIDEIETHLHPRWKMRIMSLLREAFPKVQFIVSTHDPLCLRGMYDGEVFVLQRDPDNAVVETLTDLPTIRGMRAEQLLSSEFFGLGSTDPETDQQLHIYHSLLEKRDRTDIEEQQFQDAKHYINTYMTAGNSYGEQRLIKAARESGFDPFQAMPRVTDKAKADGLKDLLGDLSGGFDD